MPALAEVRSKASALLVNGDVLPALQLYDAIVRAVPLDFEARMKVGDCLAALGAKDQAVAVYRAVGFYCIKAGHPLSALVAARVVSESLGGEADDILASLVAYYGSESELTGDFAARLRVPAGEADIEVSAAPGTDLLAEASERARTATDSFQGFPE
ncbi:MAG: hypothetical protein KJO07_26150, partial [Deltaproteobacteria bacterium]|nr:hypothetical protein [Deltaproteobacteria bacterium]